MFNGISENLRMRQFIISKATKVIDQAESLNKFSNKEQELAALTEFLKNDQNSKNHPVVR